MKRKHNGFTLVEILVVISIIAILLGLLLPALSKSQRATKSTADQANVKKMWESLNTYANGANGRFPLPGLIRRKQVPGVGANGAAAYVPGQGEEDLQWNNTANFYSSMIAADFLDTTVLISPTETNPVVRKFENYNYNNYQPSATNPTFWDAGFLANIFRAEDGQATSVCHVSYAHCALHGERITASVARACSIRRSAATSATAAPSRVRSAATTTPRATPCSSTCPTRPGKARWCTPTATSTSS